MSINNCGGYCHTTPNRIRVRVTGLRKKLDVAKSLELLMMSQPGVKHVRANPTTGNVLVVFDPQVTHHKAILQNLADLGHMPLIREDNVVSSDAASDKLCELGMCLGKNLAKVALKQVLSGSPAIILLELL